MIAPLILNEWRALLRDGRSGLLLFVGLLLAAASTWSAASTDAAERSARAAAEQQARSSWLERDADNPHSRAHFGDFVFRPCGPLAGLDSGVQPSMGRVLRVEGHVQNASVHRPQSAASTLLRFERLEPALVLQSIVPLLLVLLGFAMVAGERESGRLRLLLVQGVSPRTLLVSKTLALWSIGAAIGLLTVIAHAFVAEGTDPLRAACFLALHLLSLLIVSAVVVGVSAWVRRAGTAAAVLLGLWVCATALVPRAAAYAANALEPLPTRDAFETAMREDREQGIDGHNPADERRIALREAVLAEYGVESVEELPINFDGIAMQADEDYGNEVWDLHFGRLADSLVRQSRLAGVAAFVNPLHAVGALSATIAGTDLRSDLEFQRQAEEYRRQLIGALNDEHAHGGSRTGEWSWTASEEFYAEIDPFAFEPPPLQGLPRTRPYELAGLAVWSALGALLVLGSARRLARGGAA